MVISMLVDQVLKITPLANWMDLLVIATANTGRVFMTTNFKSAVVCNCYYPESLLNVLQTVPLVDSILHDLLFAVISHINKI